MATLQCTNDRYKLKSQSSWYFRVIYKTLFKSLHFREWREGAIVYIVATVQLLPADLRILCPAILARMSTGASTFPFTSYCIGLKFQLNGLLNPTEYLNLAIFLLKNVILQTSVWKSK